MNGFTTAEEAASTFSASIRGRTVLITGASPGGLGAEAARVIAPYAALVIIAGRNLSKLRETESSITKQSPSANIRLLVIDLGSFESVRRAANEVNGYKEAIDVLINNAAIMQLPKYSTLPGTAIEEQFGVNHLGPFLFTNLIKPRLAASSSPRIVNVASSGHRFSPLLKNGGFPKGKGYKGDKAYGQSKTANMLFTVALAERWQDIGATSFSLHPGFIQTNLGRHLTVGDIFVGLAIVSGIVLKKVLTGKIGGTPLMLKSLGQGTSTHIVAAFDPSISAFSGSYLDDAAIHNERALAYALDKDEADKLWKLSEKLVGQTF